MSNVTNYGPIIPLYFQFVRFTMFLTTILCLGSSINQYLIIEANRARSVASGLEFSWLDLENLLDPTERDDGMAGHFWRDGSQFLNLGVTFLLILYCFIFYCWQERLAERVDQKGITASDFTVMIGNVHDTDTDEMIRDFIYAGLRQYKIPPVKIVKINRANFTGNLYRIQEEIDSHEDLMGEITNLIKAQKEKKLSDKDVHLLETKMEGIEKTRQSLIKKKELYRKRLEDDNSLKVNSVAFVTLANQAQKKRVVKFGTMYTKTVFGKILLRVLKFFTRDRMDYTVQQAPEPEDVKWKFIGFSQKSRNISFFISNTAMQFICLVSFLLQLSIKLAQQYIVQNHLDGDISWEDSGLVKLLNTFASVLISIINYLLGMAAWKLCRYEKHITLTQFFSSHTKKLVWFQIINTAFVGFALYELPLSFTDFGGLPAMVDCFFITFVVNLFLTPVMSLFNISFFLFKKWKQVELSSKLKKKEFVAMTQEELNTIFEGSDCEISYLFGSHIKWVLMAAFFSFVLPSAALIVLLFICCQYLVDRYLFLRRFKEPRRLSRELAFQLSEYCELAPLFYCVGNVYFRYEVYGRWHWADLVGLAVSLVVLVLPVRSLYHTLSRKAQKSEETT